MSCTITVFPEKKQSDGSYEVVDCPYPDREHDWPLEFQSYGMFAFLAGVRNYSGITPISEPRGLPSDVSNFSLDEISDDDHTPSWLSIQELSEFDYDQIVEDRRNNGETLDVGQGQLMTMREFLGPTYFRHLNQMVELGVDRIVFWFTC